MANNRPTRAFHSALLTPSHLTLPGNPARESAYLGKRDPWSIAVSSAFQESLFYEISDIEIEAANHMMAGRAVDLSGFPARHVSLCFAACRLALDGYQVHVITPDEQVARHRQSTMANLIHSLGLRSACLAHDAGAGERTDHDELDIIFGAAGELRTDKKRTFILIEDIDVVLVERAMTPVQLHDASVGGNGVCTGNYYQLFSGCENVAGVGSVIDDSIVKGLSLYRIKTWRPRNRPPPAPRPAIVLLSDEESAQVLHVRRRAREAANLGQCLVVEGCPAGALPRLQAALAEDVLDAAVMTTTSGWQLLSKAEPDALPEVLILEELLGDLVEPETCRASPPPKALFLLSLSGSDSWRRDQQHRHFLHYALNLTGHERTVVTDAAISGLPALFRGLFSLLPLHLKKMTVALKLKHKQRKTDRARYQSTREAMEYDQRNIDSPPYTGN